MDYQLNTRLNGNIAMTSRFHETSQLLFNLLFADSFSRQ